MPSLIRTAGAVVLLAGLAAIPAAVGASQPPLAEGSALAGLGFGDRPVQLPADGVFHDAIDGVAREHKRACGATEVFGWEIAANDQSRLDKLTDTLLGALRKNNFIMKPISSKLVSDANVVLHTADRSDRRLVVMLAFSPAPAADRKSQLVLVMCETAKK